MDEWITVKEAAKLRNCSDRTVLRWIEQREIESKRDGHRWLILKSSLKTEDSPTETDIVSILKAQLEDIKLEVEEKNKLINNLRQQMEGMSERHDTIVLQLTRQLEQSQQMLEAHREPWHKKWFIRKRNTTKFERK